ncbi:hypothetical protein Tco_0164734 [Tanacetum coccineum]
MRGRGGKIQKQKRNTTEEEGSSSQVNGQNDAYWKKFNIWYRKLRYWRHNSIPHCIDFMHVEKNVAESLVGTLLHVPGKTKDGVNARLDLAELGGQTRVVCYARRRQNNTTSSSKEIILQELDKMQAELVVTLCLLEKFFPLSFFDIMIHLTVHLTRKEGKPLSADKSSEVSAELFQKAHLYVIQNTDEIVPYIEHCFKRHKQVLKTENLSKRIAFLENEHSKSFAKWLRKEVERELAISKESVSETIRWISYGPRATVVKYDAYNINGYTFRTKCHDGKVYQNNGVSVEAIDLHISKESWVRDTKDIRIASNPFLRPYPHTILYHITDFDLAVNIKIIVVNLDSSSDNNNSDSYSTSQISTSEEIDYDSPEPPKSLLKWYHYLSDEYKDNGRFWGSKSGCNESDVKPSWKDIEKAKACMLAKAQASEASSKAKVEACGSKVKVEACGSKAKLQASTKTLIVKSPGRGTLEVESDVNLLYDVMYIEIIEISSDSLEDRKGASKATAPIFYGPSTQGLLDAYGYNTIEEYLSWNYFPSTDNESTDMETTNREPQKDGIVDSKLAMLNACTLHLQLAYAHCICTLHL